MHGPVMDPGHRELFDRYQPLARQMARRYAKGKTSIIPELLAAANWGLWEAARTHVAARGPFGAWAACVIRREIIDWQRKATPFPRHLPESARPEFCQLEPEHLSPDPRPGVAMEAADEVRDVFRRARLDRRERWVIENRYGRGRSQDELGTALGLTGSMVSMIESAAVAKIRRRHPGAMSRPVPRSPVTHRQRPTEPLTPP